MRSPARILFVLFTLLLTVQGEPVLGARTKVIVRPAAGRSVPEEAYGICLPPSGCHATAWRSAATMHSFRRVNGWRRCRRTNWRHEAFRGWTTSCGSGGVGIFASFWNFARPRRSRFGGGACRTGVDPAACRCCDVRGHSLRPMHRAVAAHWPKSHCGRPMEPGSGRGCLADRGRCGGVRALRRQIVQSPPLRLVAGRDGRGGVRGLFLHRMRVGSKSDVKRVAQRRPADRGLGCSIRPGMPPRCGPMASISS